MEQLRQTKPILAVKKKNKHKNKRTEGTQGRSTKTKTPVAVLVGRNGNVRAKKVADVSKKTLQTNIRENIDESAQIMTDEWTAYQGLDQSFSRHGVVDHRKGEYANGDIYTNTAESWISLHKRGIVGTFHHVSDKHLDRYVNEFGFRWDNRKIEDGVRAISAIKATEGKRLFYKEPIE